MLRTSVLITLALLASLATASTPPDVAQSLKACGKTKAGAACRERAYMVWALRGFAADRAKPAAARAPATMASPQAGMVPVRVGEVVSVIGVAGPPPAGVPSAPQNVTAAAGAGQISVAFAPPASDGGSPVTGYAAACGPQSANGGGSPITVPVSNGTYTCTATAANANGSGPASSPSNSVVVGDTGNCPGFARTLRVEMPWANPTRMYTSSYGGFGPTDALVVKFTTGNVDSPSNYLPAFVLAEYASPPSARLSVLSETACDFNEQQQYLGAVNSGNTITSIFLVCSSGGSCNNYGYYPILKKNTVYYLNVKNFQNAGCGSNAATNCDMYIDLQKPNGI